jgi:hypothetical protein
MFNIQRLDAGTKAVVASRSVLSNIVFRHKNSAGIFFRFSKANAIVQLPICRGSKTKRLRAYAYTGSVCTRIIRGGSKNNWNLNVARDLEVVARCAARCRE